MTLLTVFADALSAGSCTIANGVVQRGIVKVAHVGIGKISTAGWIGRSKVYLL